MDRKYFPERITIKWLKNQYNERKLTPVEVLDELLLRRQEHQSYHIWINPFSREQILEYIEALPEYSEELPLWGIPFGIKDNIDMARVETTAACPAYAYIPEESATTVAQLMAAGAIPMGKTNLDQFATGLVGTRSPYGEVSNSLRPELISGGSSSGSAVSVALGEVCFSLGTDTAGSGRVPAALNNLVGLKTSIGAWSTKGVVPACASLDCVTVFAVDLEDAYLVDKLLRKEDRECVWSRAMEVPKAEMPEKVLLPKEEPAFYGPFAEKYRNAWKEAIKRLEACDVFIEYVDTSLFSQSASILYGGPWVAERWADLKDFVKDKEEEVFPVTRQILKGACKEEFDAASVFTAMHHLQDFRSQAQELLKNAILILPTCGGTYSREEVRNNPIETNNNMGLYTNHCNLLDMAAIAIPAGWAAPALPFGLTAFSLHDKENFLKGFAESYMEMEYMELAVCGLHMKGMPLEKQLSELGAVFDRIEHTAPCYRMYKLPSRPTKPMLVRNADGMELELEVWKIPIAKLGVLMQKIPAPLALGKLQLKDGSEIVGFVGQMSSEPMEDVTRFGGWRYVPEVVQE